MFHPPEALLFHGGDQLAIPKKDGRRIPVVGTHPEDNH